jgi:hypothetical protein
MKCDECVKKHSCANFHAGSGCELYRDFVSEFVSAKMVRNPSELDRKDTNPKDAIGTRKVAWSCIPTQVIGLLGCAMTEGSVGYGRHNYRAAGVRASVYFDANFRHLGAFWEGQDIDPKSGLHHVIKAIASLTVLMDSILQGNWVDDRPPKAANQKWVEDRTADTCRLIDACKEPKPAYTELTHPTSMEDDSND